jgi:hypothetical protein
VSLGLADIMDAATSHAQATGWFDQVTGHEPKSAPGRGIACAVFVRRARPVSARSGLSSTSACVELSVRVYMNMLHEPQDEIDPTIISAVDDLMAAYTGDYTLGGLVSNVDLLGAHGPDLRAEAGYISIDNKVFRSVDITLPLIVNDLWSQSG